MSLKFSRPVAGFVLCLFATALAREARAQLVDPTFNAVPDGNVEAVALQSDGKIIIGGAFATVSGVPRQAIARLLSDGAVDTGFTPFAQAGRAVKALAVQPDGKILVGGTFSTFNGAAAPWLVRLSTAGTLDSGFTPPALVGLGGLAPQIQSIVVQPDGRILVGGLFQLPIGGVNYLYLIRLQTDGTLDGSFLPLPGGTVYALQLLNNGSMLVGGQFSSIGGISRAGIARVNANGTPDATFNVGTGVSGVASVNAIAIRPDGRIVIGGSFNNVSGLSRNNIAVLEPNGSINLGIDPNITGPNGVVSSLVAQSDGTVLVGGNFLTVGGLAVSQLARILPSGSPDPSFVPFTGVCCVATVRKVVVQPDGKILIGGDYFGNRIMRLLPNVPDPEDPDNDDLPTTWETQFGLDPGSSTGNDGAAGDPDADGRTNAQELTDGTHPRGTFQRYLAEGATSSFFKTRIALLNTGASTAHVQLRYLKGDGTVTSQVLALPALRRHTIDVATIAGLANAEFSTVVEADDTVVVDRTMSWDGAAYGSHAESGVRTPAATWYLAEGSTVGGFSLFYLIQNPSLTQTSNVRVTFLRPNGTTVVKTYSVGPKSRFNIWVNQVSDVAATDVSGIVETTNGVPIIVERAMYLSTPSQVFAAGHESAAITAPSPTWFFAEGATGTYFDEFVLIANPNATAAQVRATFLLPNGTTLTKDYAVAATSRFNIWVDEESFPGVGKALANTAVSVTLQALNGVPFIAERSMWWPGPTFATWAEAHYSPGATQTGTKWALAEGEVSAVGAADQTDTYVLAANTSTSAGVVQVTLRFEDGTSVQKTFGVAARSRFNVWVKAEFPAAVGKRFGAIVESVGATPVQLVVERAMYSNAGGVVWAAGTNALATRLQ